jgi:hypothetical protein
MYNIQGSTKVFKSRLGRRLACADTNEPPSLMSGPNDGLSSTKQASHFLVASESVLLLIPEPVTCFCDASYCADVWQSLPLMSDFRPPLPYSLFIIHSQLLPCHHHVIHPGGSAFLQSCFNSGSIPPILRKSIFFFFVFYRRLTYLASENYAWTDACREPYRPS